jgi:LmbE family N-acetylglucosaminyl deacetylase
MMALRVAGVGDRRSVLCLGAHADDIEIGAGATIMAWIDQGLELDVLWCVLSGAKERQDEALRSAGDFLAGAGSARVEVMQFKDGLFPAQGEEIKAWFEALKLRTQPDLILTHARCDAHQDHREVCRHTWNTFRDHLILEYEIPKWDGDLGQPNLYVPIARHVLERKVQFLMCHFGTQRTKHWYDEETFRALARLRGIECRAKDRYAEAFHVRKLMLE